MTVSRRQTLALVSSLAVSGVAGCIGAFQDDASADANYEQLQQRPIYVAEDVALTVPDDIRTVTEPADADLVVLTDDPDTNVDEAVDWLLNGQAVALFGDDSQDTWLAWVQSDAYHEAFEPEGSAVGDPAPHLLIAWDTGPVVTTQHKSWSGGPDDHDVLEALDETLSDIPI